MTNAQTFNTIEIVRNDLPTMSEARILEAYNSAKRSIDALRGIMKTHAADSAEYKNCLDTIDQYNKLCKECFVAAIALREAN